VASLVIHRFKFILVYSTIWTEPILGKIFKSSARGNTVIRVTHGWIVNVVTDDTLVLFHDELLYPILENATAISPCPKKLQRLLMDIGGFFNGKYRLSLLQQNNLLFFVIDFS